MSTRMSIVDNILVRNVVSSSTFQIGDSEDIQARVRALAVQKQYPIYSKNEGDFSNFPIFSKPLDYAKITEQVSINIDNVVPIIKTGDIKITSVASASVMHVGNTGNVELEARVKHFRRFFRTPAGYTSDDGHPVLERND